MRARSANCTEKAYDCEEKIKAQIDYYDQNEMVFAINPNTPDHETFAAISALIGKSRIQSDALNLTRTGPRRTGNKPSTAFRT